MQQVNKCKNMLAGFLVESDKFLLKTAWKWKLEKKWEKRKSLQLNKKQRIKTVWISVYHLFKTLFTQSMHF